MCQRRLFCGFYLFSPNTPDWLSVALSVFICVLNLAFVLWALRTLWLESSSVAKLVKEKAVLKAKFVTEKASLKAKQKLNVMQSRFAQHAPKAGDAAQHRHPPSVSNSRSGVAETELTDLTLV